MSKPWQQQALERAIKRIERGWTRRHAVDSRGRVADWFDASAVRFSASSAIQRECFDLGVRHMWRVLNFVQSVHPELARAEVEWDWTKHETLLMMKRRYREMFAPRQRSSAARARPS